MSDPRPDLPTREGAAPTAGAPPAADLPPPQSAAAAGPPAAPDAAVDAAEQRRRRRRWLLLLLSSLVMIFFVIGGWYLIFRKPIGELVPPIAVEKTPHFSFSIYGVARPLGVAVNADGSRIYVTESEGDRLVRAFDNKGKQIAAFQPPGSSPATRIPVYVAIDPLTADVYVTDRPSGAVFIYDREGKYAGRFVPQPAIPAWQPLGITFDAAGNLYISDVATSPHQVLVFGRDRVLKGTITAADAFNFPNGLVVDARGDLYVADGNNGRVVAFDASSRQLAVIPRGFGIGELGLPRGEAIDDAGRLYVADSSAHVIQMYRLDPQTGLPKYIATVGQEGIGDGAFEYPSGVATDTRDRIYIADSANDRVDVWSY